MAKNKSKSKETNLTSERERKQKRRLMQLLYEHDNEARGVDINKRGLDKDSLEVEREKLRHQTIKAVEKVVFAPDTSYRDLMRDIMHETLQIFDDGLAVNKEAEEIASNFTITSDDEVIAEWDSRDFGILLEKLVSIRRTWLLSTALVGYDFAKDIVSKEIERKFGPRLVEAKKK